MISASGTPYAVDTVRQRIDTNNNKKSFAWWLKGNNKYKNNLLATLPHIKIIIGILN